MAGMGNRVDGRWSIVNRERLGLDAELSAIRDPRATLPDHRLGATIDYQGTPQYHRAVNTDLAQSIRSAQKSAGVALQPFVAAGYPSMEAVVETLKALDLPGIGAIEIGFPFSDPIADGPVIQEAFNEALTKGLKTQQIFSAIEAAKSAISKPLVAMVSYSIVFRYGTERFIADAKRAGFKGILIPDLPPPEAQGVCDKIAGGGLDSVLLVAPTTTSERRALIAKLCTGFVYYLSVSGVTGERDKLPQELAENVHEIRTISHVPVCVGFGIGRRDHVEQLSGVGDGAIVGSAIVRKMRESAGQPPLQTAKLVRSLCSQLLGT
jgi:tryptophan synthase alpha chain